MRRSAPASTTATTTTAARARERVLTLIAVAQVHGTPEPCGCQSDPLGDVARVAGLVTQAKQAGGALLLDAGGLRYASEPVSPEKRAQARAKADFLEQAWRELGALVALGRSDFEPGAGAGKPDGGAPEDLPPGSRLAANVDSPVASAPVMRTVAGVRVGVFGLVDPDRAPAGMKAGDPVAAARKAVASLRARKADLVIALAHLGRLAARRLARQVPGIDVVVAGEDVGDGGQPEQVGGTILVQPADQARKAARIELHFAEPPPGERPRLSTKLYAGKAERDREIGEIGERIARVDKELAALVANPAADPDFVKTKQAEDRRLRTDRETLKEQSAAPPPLPYARAELVAIRRKLPRDPKIAADMKQLDARVGEANREAAAKVPVPPAPKGEPHYVGIDDCEMCHSKEVAFWRTTVHHHAWQELVAVNKQWSYDCIGCHVTGYGQAGGSAMAHVDGLKDVQCEVCHGPGSAHADKPHKVRLSFPTESTCRGCHTPEHSDTFQYEAYLRDVLGPGHGEKRRKELGPGPTGHELRHGAEERAKSM